MNMNTLTITFEPVPDVLERPDDSLQVEHEGEHLAVLVQAVLRDHDVQWPAHLARDEID